MAGENPGDRAGLTRLMMNRCAERAALEARRVKGETTPTERDRAALGNTGKLKENH